MHVSTCVHAMSLIMFIHIIMLISLLNSELCLYWCLCLFLFFTCTRGIMLPFILASLLVLLRMPIVIFVNANIFIFIHVNVQSLLLVFMSFFFCMLLL